MITPYRERTYKLHTSRVPAQLRALATRYNGNGPARTGGPRVYVHMGPTYEETGEVLVYGVVAGPTFDRTRIHTLVHRDEPGPEGHRWEYVHRTVKQHAVRRAGFGWYAIQNWADALGVDAGLIDLDLDDVLDEPE
jgi:hypothetical protein